jgi:hypothetical protein
MSTDPQLSNGYAVHHVNVKAQCSEHEHALSHFVSKICYKLPLLRMAHLSFSDVSFHASSGGDIPLAPMFARFRSFPWRAASRSPVTQMAIDTIAEKLKSGAPFISITPSITVNGARLIVSRLQHRIRVIFSETVAATVSHVW